MARLIFFSLLIFAGHVNAYAQLAIGLEPLFRTSTGKVGSTYGVGLCIDNKEDNFFFRSGFSITSPLRFSGTATLDAFDSSTVPYNVLIPIEQKVTDYILHIGGGASFNPNKKSHFPVATFGLRFIYRNIDVKYLDSFDASIYNKKHPHRQPYIPAALNVGLNLGLGYWYEMKYLALFPNFSFGFGSGDRRNQHPWNDFPAYLELGCRVLITKSD